jgi:signal transduction histidine kinase
MTVAENERNLDRKTIGAVSRNSTSVSRICSVASELRDPIEMANVLVRTHMESYQRVSGILSLNGHDLRRPLSAGRNSAWPAFLQQSKHRHFQAAHSARHEY